ncbi:MAG: hypothetical protein ACHRHE_18675 [Tepidisphaerales bacterium]
MAAVKSDELSIPGLPGTGDSGAARQARLNYAAGLAALGGSQPDVAAALPPTPPDIEWLHARDGALSAKVPAAGWLGQCSLPLRAAGELLADLSAPGRVSLLLYPTHAAQVGIVLERLTPQQAVIVLHETLFDAACALACHDFAADIRAGRLYVLAGPEWPGQLDQLLSRHVGLPSPQQYLRTALLAAEAGQRLIEVAGRVINDHAKRSAAIVEKVQSSLRPRAEGPVLLLAGSAYHPWDLATPALMALLRDNRAIPHSLLDVDRPDCSSVPGLLAALQGHRAILTAELTRKNLPAALPADFPVVTWLLYGQVPSASTAGPRDRLIVASRELDRRARQGGWNAERVLLAVPPVPVLPAGGPHLGIIADYVDLDPAQHAFQLSSHRLLFEAIGEELLKDPLAVGSSVMNYLTSRAGQLNLRPENLDLPLFIERLILPVYARGIARLLVSRGLPVRLIGAGWESDEQLRGGHGGNPHNREELYAAIGQCGALVNVWPVDHPPPLQLFGRAVLPTAGRSEAQLIEAARALTRIGSPAGQQGCRPYDTPPVLTAEMLFRFLSA